VSHLFQDVRYALRGFQRAPGFAVFAVLTLALGIGATTSIFSLLHTLFLRPLPVENPEQIVHIQQTLRGRREPGGFAISFADYSYFREHSTSFSAIAAHYSGAPLSLAVGRESQFAIGGVVTANYFPMLGLRPALGRFFDVEEDAVPDRNPVAILSYSLWQARYGGDPQALGKVIQLNGEPFSIIGIAPKGFNGFHGSVEVDVWMPSAMFRVGYRYCDIAARGCRPLYLTARLKPGRTSAHAQAEMDLLAHQLEAQHPETNKGRGIQMQGARGLGPGARNQGAAAVNALSAAVAFLMLIASANLAGLLLARGVKRRKEMAVRLALGAGRGRLVRQLLTEGLLLSVTGGALGLLVAVWANHLLSTLLGASYSGIRTNFHVELNPLVLGVTMLTSLLTGIFFSLYPALEASRPDLIPALKDQRAIPRRLRLRGGLVALQVALAVVLLVAAGLAGRSLQSIYRGPGFDTGQVLTLRIRPTLLAYDGPKAYAVLREIHQRLNATPGVLSVSPADYLPVGFHENTVGIWLPGQEPSRREDAQRASVNAVGPGFFKTLQMDLLEGRDFTEHDQPGEPLVAVVNDLLAHRYWPGSSAVGQTLVADGKAYTIVGVVRDAQYYSGTEPPRPFFYSNFWQRDPGQERLWDSRTHVRVTGDPAPMLPVLLREVAAVDAALPVSEAYPLTERLRYAFAPVRVASTALSFFGGLAVFLSALGLYGVLAFAVSQRTREIGIRMALGAHPRDVLGMMLRQGATLALTGLGAGLAAAFVSSRALASLLYGVSSHDWVTFAGAPAVLLLVALVACWLPARRAARTDPMVALRYE
jgi:predicted permease